jgi:hypothetical protein
MRSYLPITVVVVGLVLIAAGIMMQQIMPVLGRAAFQAAAAGSYNPGDYRLNLTWYYLIAGIIIGLGAIAQATEKKK